MKNAPASLFLTLGGDARQVADGLLALAGNPERAFLIEVVRRKCTVTADRSEVLNRFEQGLSSTMLLSKRRFMDLVRDLRFLPAPQGSEDQPGCDRPEPKTQEILDAPEDHLILNAWDAVLSKSADEALMLIAAASRGFHTARLIDPAFDRTDNKSGRVNLLKTLFQCGVKFIEVTGAAQHHGATAEQRAARRVEAMEHVQRDALEAWQAFRTEGTSFGKVVEPTNAYLKYYASRNHPNLLHDRYIGLYPADNRRNSPTAAVALCLGSGVASFNDHNEQYRTTCIARIAPNTFEEARKRAADVRCVGDRRFTTPLDLTLGPDGKLLETSLDTLRGYHIASAG